MIRLLSMSQVQKRALKLCANELKIKDNNTIRSTTPLLKLLKVMREGHIKSNFMLFSQSIKNAQFIPYYWKN
jgi:hypothetical protein